MHLAICDDNIDDLCHITALVEQYGRQRASSITYETFHCASELLDAINKRQFNLLLIDILMPGFTGMEAAREIRLYDKAIPIIFLTSSREFAVESYRVSAENYILKPAQANEIFPTLDKLLAKMLREEAYLTLKTGDSLVRLPLSEIVYVEVMNRKVQFTLVSGDVKDSYGYLVDFEKDLLLDASFLKPHRSYIVNLCQVTALDKSGFVMITGKTVPVARELFAQTKTAYMKYLLSPNGGRNTLS